MSETRSLGKIRREESNFRRTITVRQVLIGSRNSQNNGIGIGNILQTHAVNLSFNILRLITHGDLGNSRQVHQSQCQDSRRKYLEMNRRTVNTLVSPRQTIRLGNDFSANLSKVMKLCLGNVQEFTPFFAFSRRRSSARWPCGAITRDSSFLR